MELSDLNPFASDPYADGHHKMDAPATDHRLDAMVQGVLGKPINRPDGPLKVSGQAPYAAEYNPVGLATGVLVPATIAKGRVTHIDEASVAGIPGVLGVFSGDRFIRNPAQGGAGSAPVQPGNAVHYLGQPIALVVAETFEAARDAAMQLVVRYDEDTDAVFDASKADIERPKAKQIEQGDVDAAIASAHASVDATYTTPVQSSAPMEPHATVAEWDGDKLTIHGAYQMLKYNRAEIADAVGIDAENVRVLAPYVGGGFGSKLGISSEAVAAALAARALKRPVRVAMSRRTVFEATMRRTETRQRVRLAVDAGGKLTALAHEARVSNLQDEGFSEPVAAATHFLYAGENRAYVHEIARVNLTCAGSVRAPGEAVGMLAL
ncbi:MAG: molybdopterin cofactor-binding domain-containing protein, partial [Pseudomonadota bacterium]